MNVKKGFTICFYHKYKDTIQFNTNLLIAGASSLFISAFFAQVFFFTVSGNYVLDSVTTAAIEYAIDTPVFFLLYYIGHRLKYTKKGGGSVFRHDVYKMLGLFVACDILYVIVKTFMQVQSFVQIYGIQPYEAAILSSLIGWAVYIIVINLTLRASNTFTRPELVWYYSLIIVIALSSSVILFSGLNVRMELSQPMIDISAITALGAGIAVVFRQHILHVLRLKRPFLFIMIGLSLWVSAEMTWTYYEFALHIKNPFPTIADGLWLTGYTFFIIALYQIMGHVLSMQRIKEKNPVNNRIERHRIISILVATIAAATIAITYVFVSIQTGGTNPFTAGIGSSDLTEFVISVAYPILDIVLLVPILLIIYTLRGSYTIFTHWILIGIFVILNAVGDVGFAYTELLNANFADTQEWIWDVFFNASYICLAGALLWFYKFNIIPVTDKIKE